VPGPILLAPCAACGRPIYVTGHWITVTDTDDVQSINEYAGLSSRFVHDYKCLLKYAELREQGLDEPSPVSGTGATRKRRPTRST
jgi:hypothetical protein